MTQNTRDLACAMHSRSKAFNDGGWGCQEKFAPGDLLLASGVQDRNQKLAPQTLPESGFSTSHLSGGGQARKDPERELARSQSAWALQFSEPRLFPTPNVDGFVPHTHHVNT